MKQKTIPGIMWGIMDSGSRKLQSPNLLGLDESGNGLVGTCFSALFRRKKTAVQTLVESTNKWPGARIVKLRIEEIE